MPRSKINEAAQMRLRKLMVRRMELPRGIGAIGEQLLRRLVRSVDRAMTPSEHLAADADGLPLWLTREWLRDRYYDVHLPCTHPETIAEPIAEPIVAIAAPIVELAAAVRPVKQMMFDRFACEHLQFPAVRAEAQRLKDETDRFASWNLNRIRRLLAWRRWRAMDAAAKAPYADGIIAARIKVRQRDGRFASIVNDRAALADLVPPAPIAFRALTPTRLKRKALAAIGEGFLEAAGKLELSKHTGRNGPSSEAVAQLQSLIANVGRRLDPSQSRTVKRVMAIGGFSRRQCRKVKATIAADAAIDVAVATPRRGRALGSTKVTSEELRALFVPHAVDTCRYSQRMKCETMALDSSIKSIVEADAKIWDLYSYRTICRKLRHGRLALCPAKNRSDKCSICAVWDQCLSKRLFSFLKEVKADVQKLEPGFFGEWEPIAMASDWTDKHPKRIEEPDFLEVFDDYIASKAAEIPENHELQCLVIVIHENFVGEDGWIQILKENALHWQMRTNIRDTLRLELRLPAPRVCHIWWDFAKVTGKSEISIYKIPSAPVWSFLPYMMRREVFLPYMIWGGNFFALHDLGREN
jgi:hypothetical protein